MRLRLLARIALVLLLGVRAAAGGESDESLLDALGAKGSARLYEVVPLRLRDGTILSATLLVPDTAGKRPTILIQTPYAPKFELGIGLEREVMSRLLAKGYAIAIVNVRGTQWSEGEYHWMKGARND